MKKLLVLAMGILMTAAISTTSLSAAPATTTHLTTKTIMKDGGKKHKKDCCKDESKCKDSKKCKHGKAACCSDHEKKS